MDFKKIKPKDVLGFLDDLVAKIPESIASIFRKLMIGVLLIALGYGIYWGYLVGVGSAKQEGQELAKDTKSLFQEDIEREYNRKRKNIRMPSDDTLIGEDLYKTPKQYERYGRQTEPDSIYSADDSLVENDKSIRSLKRKGDSSPLAELNDVPATQEFPIPNRNENSESNKGKKRKLYLKDNFDDPLSGSESRDMEGIFDRVNTDPNSEKKILNRKDSKDKIDSTGNMELPTKKTGSLETEGNPQKKDTKGKLLPLDGNQ